MKEKIEISFLRGVKVFVASHKEDIRLGDEWFKEIEQNLRESETVILLLSPRSVRRPWVNFEAGGGWFLKKHLIPVCVGGLKIDDIPPPFNSKQATELSTNKGVQSLITAIAERADMSVPSVDVSEIVEKNKSFQNNENTDTDEETSEKIKSDIVPDNSREKEDKTKLLPYGIGSAELFNWRMGEAFPGLRGIEEFYGPQAVERLMILMRYPLVTERVKSDAVTTWKNPFWWFRGTSNMHIERFEKIGEDRILMNEYEMTIDKIVAVRCYQSDERNFVYVEVRADEPVGVYNYEAGEIEKTLIRRLSKDLGYYVFEPYGISNKRAITMAEYEDGAAIIDEKPTPIKDAEYRNHYLTKYNFILCGQVHVINQKEYDIQIQIVLDRILLNKEKLERLIEIIDKLPRSTRFHEDL